MVKINLEMKAVLEHIEAIYPDHPAYDYCMKFKCQSCNEVSEKWHHVTATHKFETKSGKNQVHYLAKCKLCGRENTLEIVENSDAKYGNEDQGKFKPIITLECRGLEPTDFAPNDGWIAVAEESGQVFNDVDLTEKEWVEYDDKANRSVGVYGFEARFVKIK